jgi:hypothetical protein
VGHAARVSDGAPPPDARARRARTPTTRRCARRRPSHRVRQRNWRASSRGARVGGRARCDAVVVTHFGNELVSYRAVDLTFRGTCIQYVARAE